jgi:hypothetical protein
VAFTPRASLELDQLQLTLRDVPRSLIVDNRTSGKKSGSSGAAALQIQFTEMTGKGSRPPIRATSSSTHESTATRDGILGFLGCPRLESKDVPLFSKISRSTALS